MWHVTYSYKKSLLDLKYFEKVTVFYLDVSPEHVLDVLLLEPALDDELVVAVDGAHRAQLGEQEGQQMLRLPMQPKQKEKEDR